MEAFGLDQLVMGPEGLASIVSTNGGSTVEVSYLDVFEPGMDPFSAPRTKVAVAELRQPTREDIRVAGEQWLAKHPGFVPKVQPQLVSA